MLFVELNCPMKAAGSTSNGIGSLGSQTSFRSLLSTKRGDRVRYLEFFGFWTSSM
jgi:hypothetical protein